MQTRRTGHPPFWQLIFLAALLNILSQALHEAGHWAVYQSYGRAPVWGFTSLVQTSGTPPLHPAGWVEIVNPGGEHNWLRLGSAPTSQTEDGFESAAGPIASLVGVLVGLSAWRWGQQAFSRQAGLMFALAGSFVMSAYYARSGMRTGGDEFSLAQAFGFSQPAVEWLLGLAFAGCLLLCLKALGNWQEVARWLGALLLGMFPTAALLVLGNDIVRSQVDQANPLFAPVLGYSLPVFLVNGLALFLLVLWYWKSRPSQQGPASAE